MTNHTEEQHKAQMADMKSFDEQMSCSSQTHRNKV